MQEQSWYSRRILPYLVEFACGLPPIVAQRGKVIPHAAGCVLEIGIGTGLNLPLYDRRKVRGVVGVDPADQMHPLARGRSERLGLPVQLCSLSAERLPFETGSFDCVACTYTLCSIEYPQAALEEIRRVLRPGGKFLIAEHGLAPDAAVARWQHRIEPWWSRIAGGCHLTRDVRSLLATAGFRSHLESAYIARPKFLAYNYWGMATPA